MRGEDVRKNLRMDQMETNYDFCQRMKRMMDDNKAKVSTTLALMDMETNQSNEVIMKWMVSFAKSQVSVIDDMPGMVTEVVGEMDSMQEEVMARKVTDNRQEILTKGLAAIKAKVRSDMPDEWTRLA
jgi:hypothetical protein